MLMNVDISASNFSRAINFEAMSDGSNQGMAARAHTAADGFSDGGDSSCVEQELGISIFTSVL